MEDIRGAGIAAMKVPVHIHIPKTGGYSVRDITLKYNPAQTNHWHTRVSRYAHLPRLTHFLFTFTRNPHDRLVSAYTYLRKGGRNKNDLAKGKTLPADFKTFVMDHLKGDLNWWHFRPMTFYVNGDVDFIGRFENLNEDFNYVCDQCSMPACELPHLNNTKHHHYMDYYDDETFSCVKEIYQKDFETFGY